MPTISHGLHVESLEPRQLMAATIPHLYDVYTGVTSLPKTGQSLEHFDINIASQSAAGKLTGQLELTVIATGQTFDFSFTGSVNARRSFTLHATGDAHRKLSLRGKIPVDPQFGVARNIDGVFRSTGKPIAARGLFGATSPFAPV